MQSAAFNEELASQGTFDMPTALTLAIALVAALGVGSIVAAVISRWNTISGLRQGWVNSLRDEISVFFHKVDRFGAIARKESYSSEELSELRLRRDAAMAAYRQIMLRLNFRETTHRRLDKALMDTMDIADRIDDEKMRVALIYSRRVLKAEWERTKFGPFLAVAQKFKSVRRRSRLRRHRRKRRATKLT